MSDLFVSHIEPKFAQAPLALRRDEGHAPLGGIVQASGLPMALAFGRPVAPAPFSPAYCLAKRIMDIVISAAALVFLAPLFLLVALAIKLTSSGPVLFVQMREGYRGRPFGALKFRSMHELACDASGVTQTVADDPRVSPIGRFLRASNIDELPQLLNVLRGEMSLVGPRPHVAGMTAGGMLYRDLVPYYDLRLQALPGLTGWAQANGYRGPTRDGISARARIDHDIAYLQNASIWLDIKIVLLTLRRELLAGSGL